MSEPVLDLSEIIGLYKTDARRSVDQMRAALQQWDDFSQGGAACALVRKLAHQLRGSGRTYGFRDVTRIAKAMEKITIKIQAKTFAADDRLRDFMTASVKRLAVIFD
jgi:chemotaxis protein histidine kinase CheA